MVATTHGLVPPEAAAHHALVQLAGADPASTHAGLGLEQGTAGVRQALGYLREALAQDPRPDAALDLLRRRVHADLPAGDADRRAALMTLMVAQGTARQHVRVPFDQATVAQAVQA